MSNQGGEPAMRQNNNTICSFPIFMPVLADKRRLLSLLFKIEKRADLSDRPTGWAYGRI